VPFIVGSNKDEYRAFLSSFGLASMSGYSDALLGALGRRRSMLCSGGSWSWI